jgi:membrane protein DedA with SNARE-associated domain
MSAAFLHLIKAYGYLGVFASLMLGIFGLPVPDETIMTFIGFLISKSYLKLIPAVLAAFAGSVCGITLSYAVGWFAGLRLITKYGRYVRVTPEKFERAHRWFERYGKWALFAGYFFPGLRHLTAFSAGAARLEYWVFAPFAYAGGLLWVVSFITLGYFVGEEWHKVMPRVQNYLWVAVGAVVALGLVMFLGYRLRAAFRNKRSRPEG